MSSTPSSATADREQRRSTSQVAGSSVMHAPLQSNEPSSHAAFPSPTVTTINPQRLTENIPKPHRVRDSLSRSRSGHRDDQNAGGNLGVRSLSMKELGRYRPSSSSRSKIVPTSSSQTQVQPRAIEKTARKMFEQRMRSRISSAGRKDVEGIDSESIGTKYAQLEQRESSSGAATRVPESLSTRPTTSGETQGLNMREHRRGRLSIAELLNSVKSTESAEYGVKAQGVAAARAGDSGLITHPLPALPRTGSSLPNTAGYSAFPVLPQVERPDSAAMRRDLGLLRLVQALNNTGQGMDFQHQHQHQHQHQPSLLYSTPLTVPRQILGGERTQAPYDNTTVQPQPIECVPSTAGALYFQKNTNRQRFAREQSVHAHLAGTPPVANKSQLPHISTLPNVPSIQQEHLQEISVAQESPVREQELNTSSQIQAAHNREIQTKYMAGARTEEEALALRRQRNKLAARRYRKKMKGVTEAEHKTVEDLREELECLQFLVSENTLPGQSGRILRINHCRLEALQAALSFDPNRCSSTNSFMAVKGVGQLRREVLTSKKGRIFHLKRLDGDLDNAACGFASRSFWEGIHESDVLSLSSAVRCLILHARQQVVLAYRRKVVDTETKEVKEGEYIRIKGFFYPFVRDGSVKIMMSLEFDEK